MTDAPVVAPTVEKKPTVEERLAVLEKIHGIK